MSVLKENVINEIVSKMREILNEDQSLSLFMDYQGLEIGRTGMCLEDGFDFSADFDFRGEIPVFQITGFEQRDRKYIRELIANKLNGMNQIYKEVVNTNV